MIKSFFLNYLLEVSLEQNLPSLGLQCELFVKRTKRGGCIDELLRMKGEVKLNNEKFNLDLVLSSDQRAAKLRRKRLFSSAVCGQRRYDPTFDICCGGTIRSRSGISPACCGTQNYDTRFDMCCGGVIRRKSGIAPACCGTQAYDARFKRCCGWQEC